MSAKREFISKFTKGYRWQPAKIVYEASNEDLTSAGGMGNIIDLFTESPHFEAFRNALPERKSNASYDTAQFGLTALSSFWFDHDCIDDIEEFSEDPGLEYKIEGVPSKRAMGDWLHDFDTKHIDALNEFLIKQSLSIRKKLAPENPIVMDMDSTSHEQTAKKMEGLAYNYKNQWCLDSLLAFDDMGLCYNMALRAGNVFSAKGAPEMIHRIFGTMKKDAWASKRDRFFRADSAFCNEEVIHACLRNEVKFTITAHGNTGWQSEAHNIPEQEWHDWKHSNEEILKAAKRNKPLDKIQIATLSYRPTWSEQLMFAMVVKRTWVEYGQGDLFSGQGYWQYYAVLTNLSLHKWSAQSVMHHHCHRGQSENFIREAKYGYDLKHFPCLKMRPNHAYGLLGLVAHNFHRGLSWVDDPRNPKFSKRFRRKYVFIPGKLIRHARSLTMRIPQRFLEEVKRLRKAWLCPPVIELTFRLRLNTA
jgi:hypothetical protein